MLKADTCDVIKFISASSDQFSPFDGEEREEGEPCESYHLQGGRTIAKENTVEIATSGTPEEPSKTQGILPGAQLASPAKGTVNCHSATDAGATAANSSTSAPRRRGAAKRVTTCRID